MPQRASPYGHWASSTHFVLAAAGIVVGLGNVWRLPQSMAEHGGLAFLLVYALCLAGVTAPLMANEWLLGRWMRSNLVWGVRHLSRTGELSRAWEYVGWVALVGAALVLSYYAVIAGWTMAYAVRAAAGMLSAPDPANAQAAFLNLAGDAERSLAWHTIFMVMVVIVVSYGRLGLQRAALLLLPVAAVLLGVVVAYAWFDGTLAVAIATLLGFRPGDLGLAGLVAALSQAFYTLSLGVGVHVAYGTYLKSGAPVWRMASAVLAIDLVMALLAGLGVYGLLKGAGLDAAAGVPLLFRQVAAALADVSPLVALAFFLALALLTLTSAIALLEPLTQRGMERFRVTRIQAAAGAGMLVWFAGLITLLSFNVLADATAFGMTPAQWLLQLTGRLLIPFAALGLCIYTGRMLPRALAAELLGTEPSDRGFRTWYWLMRYPARVGIIIVLIDALGVVQSLSGVWLDQ